MLERDLQKAKQAYSQKDVDLSIAAHNAKVASEQHRTEGQYIKSFIYGGLDGIITTFAVVAGVAGASLSTGIVLIMGFANLIGDGLSMSIGDFLSTKAENEYNRAERDREQWEIDHYPEGEIKEMQQIYEDKGLEKQDAAKMATILSTNKSAWLRVMMIEELGIIENNESPVKSAVITFISFCFFGLIPVLSYVLIKLIPNLSFNPFYIATILTAITLFALGALKTRITNRPWLRSGLEMLLVGSLAAGSAYLIGLFLSKIG